MRGALETHLCKEHNIPKEALREWMAKAELWSINGGEATPTTNSENVAKFGPGEIQRAILFSAGQCILVLSRLPC
jgi:hypothetical protein